MKAKASIRGKLIINKNGVYVKTPANSNLVEGRPVVVYNRTKDSVTDVLSGRKIGVYEEMLGTGKVIVASDSETTIKIGDDNKLHGSPKRVSNIRTPSYKRLKKTKNDVVCTCSYQQKRRVKPVEECYVKVID